MGLVVRDKRTKRAISLPAKVFEEDKEEKYLHKIVEQKLGLLSTKEDENLYLLGSHLKIRGLELDLLTVDKNGCLGIVELKRGKSPRDVIAQILEYASTLRRLSLDELEEKVNLEDVFKRIKEDYPDLEVSLREFKENIKRNLNSGKFNLTIVSYSIDETTREIMDYLRTFGMQIKGLEFKYFESDEKEYFVTSWIGEEEVEELRIKELTPAQKRNIEVFSELLDDFKKKNPGVTYAKPRGDNWFQIPVGRSYVHLEWVIHRDWVEVGFHIENPNRGLNLKMLEFFKKKKSYLEKLTGEKLRFEPWGKRWARVYAKRARGKLDKEVRDWMKEKMDAFYKAFKPLVDEYFE